MPDQYVVEIPDGLLVRCAVEALLAALVAGLFVLRRRRIGAAWTLGVAASLCWCGVVVLYLVAYASARGGRGGLYLWQLDHATTTEWLRLLGCVVAVGSLARVALARVGSPGLTSAPTSAAQPRQ